MHYDITTEEASIQYLTGELSPIERDRFEDEYFEDDELFEQLLAAESELIDQYVEGDQSISHHHLAVRFPLDAAQREKVIFAEALHQFIAQQQEDGAWSLGKWPKRPSLLRRALGLIGYGEAVLQPPKFTISGTECQPSKGFSARELDGERVGRLLFLNEVGLAYVEDITSGEQYAFTFNRFRGYRGQSIKELGIRRGTPVRFRLDERNVSSVEILSADGG